MSRGVSILNFLFDVKIPEDMRAYLCCLFALPVVVSPLFVVVSGLLPFYLLWLTIHLSQSHIFLSASLIPAQLLLTWLLMTVRDNKASGIVSSYFHFSECGGMSAFKIPVIGEL